jgi:hypothetical protein
MRETYAPVLLARKANRLRKSTGDDRYWSKEKPDNPSLQNLFKNALVLRMLFTSLILFLPSLDVSIVYGYLYLVFTTLTYAYENQYGFSSGVSGLTFLGIGEGMFIGTL